VVPDPDPIVVYAMVTALIAALAVGIFFATPLRFLLTGPDKPLITHEPGGPDIPTDEQPAEGPWSTAPPTPDQNWPNQ